MSAITFPKRARPVTVRFDRNPYKKPGWFLLVQLGPGAGYRWIDIGRYSQNVADPWYRKLHIAGRTLRAGYHVRDWRPSEGRSQKPKKYGFQWFSKRCDLTITPGWWG